jgi:hypothetical protein
MVANWLHIKLVEAIKGDETLKDREQGMLRSWEIRRVATNCFAGTRSGDRLN